MLWEGVCGRGKEDRRGFSSVLGDIKEGGTDCVLWTVTGGGG